MPRWWNGIHASLKNWWGQLREGSTPSLGTITLLVGADSERKRGVRHKFSSLTSENLHKSCVVRSSCAIISNLSLI